MSRRLLITNASIARMTGASDYGMLRNAALLIDAARIAWVGPMSDLAPGAGHGDEIDAEGRLVTPALIDCHTHIVHGGHRAREFEMRLQGASYAEVARAGGGIVSTVEATRAADETELLADALTRVDALIGEGVATIEVKSGYGLDIETELKMLRVARKIGQVRDIEVVTSFLGAHAVPQGAEADDYIGTVCLPALEAACDEGLVDAVDGFCEGIAFTPDQIERVYTRAQELGCRVKLHAEQLSHCDGTALAARFRALSADHLEYATDDDARALAGSDSVAVMLPGAFYTLGETQIPPIEAFRRFGVPMAVATDWNPGSSPLGSLLLAMNMAATLFGLTPAEALAGTTRNAARALGFSDRGALVPEMRADLALWDVEDPAELSYRIGVNPLKLRIFGGQPCP